MNVIRKIITLCEEKNKYISGALQNKFSEKSTAAAGLNFRGFMFHHRATKERDRIKA